MRLFFDQIAGTLPFHAAYVEIRPDRRVPVPHDHDFAEAFWVTKGSGEHRVAGQRFPLHTGDLVVIRASDSHAFVSRGGTLGFINVAFRVRELSMAAEWAELTEWHRNLVHDALPLHRSFRGANRAHLELRFADALEDFNNGPSRAGLMAFLGGLLRALQAPHEVEASEGPEWLRLTLRQMRDHRNLAGGLPRMREIASVSPAYLSRTFKAVLGRTPSDWLQDIRLAEASRRLRVTNEAIGTIAVELGFENPATFFRQFRRRFGQTPASYRRDGGGAVAPQ